MLASNFKKQLILAIGGFCISCSQSPSSGKHNAASASVSPSPVASSSYSNPVLVALGDSFTRGANLKTGCQYSGQQLLPECENLSWAVGKDLPSSMLNQINSLLQSTVPQGVSFFDQAITGAASDGSIIFINQKAGSSHSLENQFLTYKSQNPKRTPDYVTIEMGANDLCQQNPGTVASSSQIANHVIAAIDAIAAMRKDSSTGSATPTYIVLAPVPNLVQFKQVMQSSNLAAQCTAAWNGLIPSCPSYLVTNALVSDSAMTAAITLINSSLEAIPSHYAADPSVRVTYAKAIETGTLVPGDVSTVDCFHPSEQGQAKFAGLAWESNWYSAALPTSP